MRILSRIGAALIVTFALQGLAVAQPIGRIEGRVFDAATGEPLVGGQVRIIETALGNVTRGDGSFFIERVPVGVQYIHTEYLGYQEENRAARIFPDRTTRLDFALGGAAIDTPAIVATIAYEPWPAVKLPTRPIVEAVPEPLPAPAPATRCEVRAALHGAYIVEGRWQMQTSVGDLRCWSELDDAEVAPCDRQSPSKTDSPIRTR